MFDATPILRLYARFRRAQLASEDAAAAQVAVLRRLLRRASGTRFGRDHDFDRIGDVDTYRRAVPLRRYEDFWTAYWQPAFPNLRDVSWPGLIPYFAVTSGTTSGVTKFIPCSAEMVRANRRAAADILVHHIANRPKSSVLGGPNLVLGGSTDLARLAPGVWRGDLSGIAARTVPWWAKSRYFPPPAIDRITDWEVKIDKMARAASRLDIRSISGTPSWLLIFFDKLAQMNPKCEGRLARLFPNLELLIHGGLNFAPYRTPFAEVLSGADATTREVYAASEGFIAVADRGDGEGMRLIADNGLFFEFIPLEEVEATNPTRHWLGEIETGVDYAVAVSTNAGLWSYLIGDTVSFVSRSPPRLLVTGRTAYSLSAFGEHLIDLEIEEAIAGAAAAIGNSVVDFSVGAIYPRTTAELGRHLFIVEFASDRPDEATLAAFASELDRALGETNEDYAAHRAEDYGMLAPRVHAVPAGTFAAWMKSRGQLGGQHKVPRIINDPTLFDNLRRFAGCD